MKYLLDSCIVSYYFRKDKNVIKNMQLVKPQDICISTITVMEIDYGLLLNPILTTKIKPLWENFQQSIEIIPFTKTDAQTTSHIRAQLRKEGQPIGPYGVLLAGSALGRDLTFVTANMKEFNRIKNLTIENWQSIEN